MPKFSNIKNSDYILMLPYAVTMIVLLHLKCSRQAEGIPTTRAQGRGGAHGSSYAYRRCRRLGSGKTTLTDNIRRMFADDITVIRHDSYYTPHDELTYAQRVALNYDHPDAFETDRLIRDLSELKQGRAVDCPTYDYTIYNRAHEVIRVCPTKVIIVEGILVLENLDLCRLLDIKIYVDTDADVRILRRIVRDVKERGRSLDSVINQYLGTVKPMHEKYVSQQAQRRPYRARRRNNSVALELLRYRIAEFIKRN